MPYTESRFRWDLQVKIITWATLLIISSLTILIFHQDINLMNVLILGPIILILFSIYLYMPYKLTVNPENISISKVCGKYKVDIQDIIEVSPIDYSEIAHSFYFGSGGLFGYYGKYNNKKYGSFVVYATDKSKLIKIRTVKGIIIISSENRTEVINHIRLLISQAN